MNKIYEGYIKVYRFYKAENMRIQEELIVAKKRIKELEEEFDAFKKKEKQYDSVLNNIKEVIFQTDANGLWTYLNRPWEEITGFSLEESMGVLFLNFVHPEDRALNQERFTPLIERKKNYCRHTIRYITKAGGFKWIEVFARLTLDEDDHIIGTSGTLNDVTERILMEQELIKHKNHLEELVEERTKALNEINEKLSYLATHDSLTNILNRYSLEKSLKEAIRKANDECMPSVLLFIDLDNFKVINDTYGHSVGDEVLVKLSRVVTIYLEENHVVARLGGDEFAVLLKESTIEEGIAIAEEIRGWLEANDIELPSGIIINITTSIGVVKIDGSLDPQKVLSYADTALYSAKNNGKNRVEIIASSEDKKRLSELNVTVTNIKKAIKKNRFILYYQPIAKTGKGIIHYEALIRMLDEEGKLIFPNEFIPISEKFGLMSQIDKWVVTNILKMLEKHPNMHIFINLSGISLGDRALLAFIEESIKNSHIDTSHLGFEITETTAIRDLVQSEKWIRKLKRLGCKFALDDFGVGFSSFSYLGNLPVDYLKIDGSFVRNVDKDPTQKALIKAMNGVAHALGKETIAEFVESEAIVKILEELNVDCLQGYYIGKPQLMDVEE